MQLQEAYDGDSGRQVKRSSLKKEMTQTERLWEGGWGVDLILGKYQPDSEGTRKKN